VLQNISLEVAGHSGAHIYPGAPAEISSFGGRTIAIRPEGLRSELKLIRERSAGLDAFLSKTHAFVEVFYEDYLLDRLDVLNRIAEWIEVDSFLEAPPEFLRKNTDNDLRKAVSNYDELMVVAKEEGLDGFR
jgi:hypothetical protein